MSKLSKKLIVKIHKFLEMRQKKHEITRKFKHLNERRKLTKEQKKEIQDFLQDQ